MEKSKFKKVCIVVLFLAIAGTLYSCRENKEPDVVFLQDSTIDETVSGIKTKDKETESQALVKEASENPATDAKEKKASEISGNQSSDEEIEAENRLACNQNELYVYICGAVMKPDVYKVNEGTRLVEVVQLAGGLTIDAAEEYVNLAAPVQDGQKVYIPTKEEVKDMKTEGSSSNLDLIGDDLLSNSIKDNQVNTNPKVNINTASEEELMSLPGIGKAKAASIIAYRQEHGTFKNIEEIMNIRGIKNSVFSKISDKITVN